MLPLRRAPVLGKIADPLDLALVQRKVSGLRGKASGRLLARGRGIRVEDVICTSGPGDRPFEERHAELSLAVVIAGSFQYRSSAGRSVMTPGSLLLGNPGDCFECGHEHAAGDRCIAFHYTPEYLDKVFGARVAARPFRAPRLPPLRDCATLIASAEAGVSGLAPVRWEELGLQLLGRALELAADLATAREPSYGALARVTDSVRSIERHPGTARSVSQLAAAAGQSPFHYLRTFQQLTGITPHQFILRARLREAARRLLADSDSVITIALESGFGDISNFNRAFRAEFGTSPRLFRRWMQSRSGNRTAVPSQAASRGRAGPR